MRLPTLGVKICRVLTTSRAPRPGRVRRVCPPLFKLSLARAAYVVQHVSADAHSATLSPTPGHPDPLPVAPPAAISFCSSLISPCCIPNIFACFRFLLPGSARSSFASLISTPSVFNSLPTSWLLFSAFATWVHCSASSTLTWTCLTMLTSSAALARIKANC